MKTKRPKSRLTKSQVAEIRKSRKEFEYCYLLVRRAASEALRNEFLEIFQRKIHELKNSFDEAIVACVMAKMAGSPDIRITSLANLIPAQVDQADYASAQVILGEMKSA